MRHAPSKKKAQFFRFKFYGAKKNPLRFFNEIDQKKELTNKNVGIIDLKNYPNTAAPACLS